MADAGCSVRAEESGWERIAVITWEESRERERLWVSLLRIAGLENRYRSLQIAQGATLLPAFARYIRTTAHASRSAARTHTHTQTHINFFDLTAFSLDTIYTPDLSLWFTRSSQYIFQATFFFFSLFQTSSRPSLLIGSAYKEEDVNLALRWYTFR